LERSASKCCATPAAATHSELRCYCRDRWAWIDAWSTAASGHVNTVVAAPAWPSLFVRTVTAVLSAESETSSIFWYKIENCGELSLGLKAVTLISLALSRMLFLPTLTSKSCMCDVITLHGVPNRVSLTRMVVWISAEGRRVCVLERPR